MAQPTTPVYTGPLTSTAEWLLYRFIERNHPRAEDAFAELLRRENAQQLEELFNPDVSRRLVNARDLKPGMVLTAGRRGRVVVRQAYPLPQSGRILASYSLVDECTGVIEDRVHDMPVQAAEVQHELVTETVPACFSYASTMAVAQ